MNRIGLEYGKWLAPMGWNWLATVRTYRPLTELTAPYKMQRLLKHLNINKLFYSIEPDLNDTHTHAHLLLDTNTPLDRDSIAEAMGAGTQPQAISYLQPIENISAVSNYCTKHIGKRHSFHDILFKEGLTFDDFD